MYYHLMICPRKHSQQVNLNAVPLNKAGFVVPVRSINLNFVFPTVVTPAEGGGSSHQLVFVWFFFLPIATKSKTYLKKEKKKMC